MTWTDILGALAVLVGLPTLWLCWREIIVKQWLPGRPGPNDDVQPPRAP